MNCLDEISKLDARRFERFCEEIVDVSDLESFGFSDQARNYLENRGLMPKPLTWDKHSGEGLSWRKEDFEATFFKMVQVGRFKRSVMMAKTPLDWCQVN